MDGFTFWGFQANRATSNEEMIRMKTNVSELNTFIKHERLSSTHDGEIEVEFMNDQMPNQAVTVSDYLPNAFLDEEWYDMVLLPFVSKAPTWEEFSTNPCRLFSSGAGAWLGLLVAVEGRTARNRLSVLSGVRVNKRGNISLVCEKDASLLIPGVFRMRQVFRALVPFTYEMVKILPFHPCTTRHHPTDLEIAWFDPLSDSHVTTLPHVFLSKKRYEADIYPRLYYGPVWEELVSGKYATDEERGWVYMQPIAGVHLGLLRQSQDARRVITAT